jgi:hypothetical protein
MDKIQIGPYLSVLGLFLTVVGGVITINRNIAETASIAEARLSRLEENSKAFSKQIERFDDNDKRLVEHIFRLERRRGECH